MMVMTKKTRYFVKSLEEDFATKTLRKKEKVTFQTVENIIKTKTIKPNTKSFGQKKRLACTLLSKQYTKTYRSQGIIFTTKDKPAMVSPFDLVLLSDADKIVVHYYRIKDKLHLYYNHSLIPGYKQFIFKDYNAMIKKYPSPERAWIAVNTFRKKKGYKALSKQKFKLVQYNEVIFLKPIKIIPVAVYGYKKESRMIAKKLGLPHYRNAKEFWNKKIDTSYQVPVFQGKGNNSEAK